MDSWSLTTWLEPLESDEDLYHTLDAIDLNDFDSEEEDLLPILQSAFEEVEEEKDTPAETIEQVGSGLPERGKISFDMKQVIHRKSQKLGVQEDEYQLQLKQQGQFSPHQNLEDSLTHALRAALELLLHDQRIHDQDFVFVNLQAQDNPKAMTAWKLRAEEWRRNTGRAQALLASLARKLNSNEKFRNNQSFNLSFVHAKTRHAGSGYKRLLPGHHAKQRLRNMRCVIKIPQDDSNLCCARAIVTALNILQAGNDRNERRKWTEQGRGKHRVDKAARLLLKETDLEPMPCGPEQLELFSRSPTLWGYYGIIVVDSTRAYTRFVYGTGADGFGYICLLYDDYHYDVITSLPAFFSKSYFCYKCFNPYNDLGRHRCKKNRGNHCSSCLQDGCEEHAAAFRDYKSPTTLCGICHRRFHGVKCLENHRRFSYKGTIADGEKIFCVCDTRRKCKQCQKYLIGKQQISKHKCGITECRCCGQDVHLATHKCYLQVAHLKKKKKKKDTDEDDDVQPKLIFFDIESTQCGDHHEANLIIACDEDTADPEDMLIYSGENCILDFINFLEYISEEGEQPIIVIAHNFQGYDGYFIIDAMRKRGYDFKQVRNRGKILQLSFANDTIKFIDSLSFFQMPKRNFPKTFGITELTKGFFPHLFNTPENQQYVGPMPPIEDYLPHTMPVKEFEKFQSWYQEKIDNEAVFNFQKEFIAYCKSDVRLLQEGCMNFKRNFEKMAKFNPFEHMTIASTCNRYLRTWCLRENSIASKPLHGWRLKTNHSLPSIEWLLNTESIHQHPIQHARNEGEFCVPYTNYKVDGYCKNTNTIFEFHGDFWHGCPTCFPQRDECHPKLLDRTFRDVYHVTQSKMTALKAKGYQVVEMWECHWNKLKQTDPQIKQFVAELNLIEPLQPRDAFFGGRTNAFKLHHICEQGEKIEYVDYMSLYPWCNKYSEYPEGHPEFILNPPGTELHQWFGLAKVTIDPPHRLYFPVLPHRYNNKLIFPLCRTCVEEKINLPLHKKPLGCTHNRKERCLTGTWCTPEILKAVEMGYEIETIHEVWHFPKTTKGLFAKYVDTWLKLKQEAKGWPKDCVTEEQKQAYIADFYAAEKIQLEYDKIKENPGQAKLSKLMLNSMWGKFGQQENKTQVAHFNEPQDFCEFLDSDRFDIRYISILDEDNVEIHYKMENDEILPGINTNIFIAAFTTCWARLRLYRALEHSQTRALYSDTDSVFVLQKEGDPPIDPPIGKCLGDFTRELDKDEHIVEFVSGGPKNYGYLCNTEKTEVKVKGFQLHNKEGADQLNFQVLKDNTLAELFSPLNEPRKTTIERKNAIKRKTKEYKIVTEPEKKDYRLVYDKRILVPGTADTLPYGYII